ncbi:hypothetical protein HK103_000108 [Boothiomyces macroporosus]|uniref:Alpha/beta hydrolase fold-3 domain-containing protein n=1 Tax=Boothiomyces macroporosus TaxID=261099 RepID=A0AAD5UMY4_9FUNG|nr:hypothetical protein HK103_000108 [Boothiomyces macroporosus]
MLNIPRVQQWSRIPNPNTSPKATVTTEKCRIRQEAIDFMVATSEHVPANAKSTDRLIPGEWVSDGKSADHPNVVYLLHGGIMERKIAYYIAKAGSTRTFAIAYRLSPQFEFPCAVIDAISGYLHLLDLGYEPGNIIFSGSSAGGGLAMATLLAIREMGLPLPGGAALISPWVDLEHSFPSFTKNELTDYLPSDHNLAFGDSLGNLNLPFLIQVGKAERLYDEDVELAKRLTDENPYYGAILEAYEEQVHVFHLFHFLPQSRLAFERIGQFVRNTFLGLKFTPAVVTVDTRCKEMLQILKFNEELVNAENRLKEMEHELDSDFESLKEGERLLDNLQKQRDLLLDIISKVPPHLFDQKSEPEHEVAGPESPPKRKRKIAIDPVTEPELATVPKYVNTMIGELNILLQEKEQLLNIPQSKMTKSQKDIYWEHKELGTEETKGKMYLLEKDLQKRAWSSKSPFVYNAAGRNLIVILRALGKIKEVRGGGHTRIVVI